MLQSLVLITILHTYWAFFQPLIIQSIFVPMNLYKSATFKTIFRGIDVEECKDAFANPMAKMFASLDPNAAAAAPEAPPKATIEEIKDEVKEAKKDK